MFREKVKKVAKKLKNPNGFSSTIASVFKSLPKKFHSAKKRRRGDLLGFFLVQLGAENQNTQRGNIKTPFATSKSF